ncbi:MAG TPA: hypothetical protein VM686_05980 [Polyangiaceae bacterium]|nr:hypothetical protein [Polyangiaceae bacterium]
MSCDVEGQVCSLPFCSGSEPYTCRSGHWVRNGSSSCNPPPPPLICPFDPPSLLAPCQGVGSCTYESECGTYVLSCLTLGSPWSGAAPDCAAGGGASGAAGDGGNGGSDSVAGQGGAPGGAAGSG